MDDRALNEMTLLLTAANLQVNYEILEVSRQLLEINRKHLEVLMEIKEKE